MKKIVKYRILNTAIWVILLAFAIHDGFMSSNDHTFSQGQLRGFVLFVLFFLLVLYPVLTIYYTVRAGGNSAKVGANLRHNYLALISIQWFSKKTSRRKA